MRPNVTVAAAAALLLSSLYAGLAAHGQPPATPPAQPAPGQPPAGGGRQGRGTFPAQQRTLADPAVIERGNTLYGINCRLCHGPDLRGGDLGGVNLLRSAGAERPRGGADRSGRDRRAEQPGYAADAADPAAGRRHQGDRRLYS